MATMLFGNFPIDVDFDTYEAHMTLQETYNQIELNSKAISMYAEAIGVSGISSIISMGFTFLSKFISSFYGIMLSVVTGLIGLLIKRKFGKTLNSISGGGGGGGGSSSGKFDNIVIHVSEDAKKLGAPGITAARMEEMRKQSNERRKRFRQRLASHREFDPVKANQEVVNALSDALSFQDVGHMVAEDLPTIFQKVKPEQLAHLIRIDIDKYNPGLMYIDNMLSPDMAVLMTKSDMYKSEFMPDALGPQGVLYLVNEEEIRKNFDDIAKAVNSQNTELDLANMIASYLSEFTDVFITSVILILKSTTVSIKDESLRNYIDSQIRSVLNEAMTTKMKTCQEPFNDRYNDVITKDDIDAIYLELTKSAGHKFKILNPKDLSKVEKAFDNILKDGIVKVKNINDVGMNLVEVGNDSYDVRLFLRDKEKDTYRSKAMGAYLSQVFEGTGLTTKLRTEHKEKVSELTNAIDNSKDKIMKSLNNLQGSNVDSVNYSLDISRSNTQILAKMLELSTYLISASNHDLYRRLTVTIANYVVQISYAVLIWDKLPDEMK